MSEQFTHMPLEDPAVAAFFEEKMEKIGPFGAVSNNNYVDIVGYAKEAVGTSLFATALTGIEDMGTHNKKRKKINLAIEARKTVLAIEDMQKRDEDEAVFIGIGCSNYLGNPDDIFTYSGLMTQALYSTLDGSLTTDYSDNHPSNPKKSTFGFQESVVVIKGYGLANNIDVLHGNGVTNVRSNVRSKNGYPGEIRIQLGRIAAVNFIPSYGFVRGITVGRENIMKYFQLMLEDEIEYKFGHSPTRSQGYNMYRLAEPDEELFERMKKQAEEIGLLAVWKQNFTQVFGMSVARTMLKVQKGELDLDAEDTWYELPAPNHMRSLDVTASEVQDAIRSSIEMINAKQDPQLADKILTGNSLAKWYDQYRSLRI